MKIPTILCILFIACLLSCNERSKEECHHNAFIHEYSKGDFESDIPPVNWGHLFFAEIDNDSIIITNNFYLYQIYKNHYLKQFSSFHLFLCSLYDNEIILHTENMEETMLKYSILFRKEATFEDRELSELKEQYFNDSRYLKTQDLTQDEEFSLLYLFFKDEYYVFDNDETGTFSMRKGNDNDPERK